MPPTRSRRSAPTRRRTPTSRGSSAAAGRWTTTRAAPRSAACSTRSCPTARCSCSAVTTTARGPTRAAIRLAGIDASTPDPVDGRIEREADGSPAGTFHEGAGDLFSGVRPPVDPELAYAGLLRAQRRAARARHHGLAGRHGRRFDRRCARPDRRVPPRARRGRRSLVHVVGAQWWERSGGIEQVDEMTARRDGGGGARPRGPAVARHDEDHGRRRGREPDRRDAHALPRRARPRHAQPRPLLRRPELLQGYVTALDAAGFQVHFHALGDRAVREALDALDAARDRQRRDRRPAPPRPPSGRRRDRDRRGSRELGAVANIQALWACHEDQIDDLTLPFLQDGAEARQYPFGDLVRHGARLAAGSDWPVSSADPMDAIHIAVNRVAPSDDSEPLGGAHQRLDLATAMAAYTSGTAYVNHRDHDTGHSARATSPTSSCSTPTRSRCPPTRSTVRRWSRRGSRASPSTPAPTDPEERTMIHSRTRRARRHARAVPRPSSPDASAPRSPAGCTPPDPEADADVDWELTDADRCALGRHRLVHLGELRRAVLARLRLRVRLRRQPGARERLRVPAAAEPRLHADRRRSPSRSSTRRRRRGSTRSATA